MSREPDTPKRAVMVRMPEELYVYIYRNLVPKRAGMRSGVATALLDMAKDKVFQHSLGSAGVTTKEAAE